MELGHILWPSDPVTRESSNPVDPVTLFYNKLQMPTYVIDVTKKYSQAKEFLPRDAMHQRY